MSRKKPLGAPLTTSRPTTRPTARKNASPAAPNARQQPDNRWQRTKRYGWDSR